MGYVMNKMDIVKLILGEKRFLPPALPSAKYFSPSNIALCKYWGKRNLELNLPVTSSLSVSLGNKGAEVELTVHSKNQDTIFLNDQKVDVTSNFAKRLIDFLNLFRHYQDKKNYFLIRIHSTIPIAAGLASSACGFASVIQALNVLFDWKLSTDQLSLLARLGSGSACRSIESGFVEWNRGSREDGLDSFGVKMQETWPELCVGLLVMSDKEKKMASRKAMQQTVETSPFYFAWPSLVEKDLIQLKKSIREKDFSLLGKTAESNALAMHATMMTAWPPIYYTLPETISAMNRIWKMRDDGLAIYFTQDAGPNLKCLFLEKEISSVVDFFPEVDIVKPFNEGILCISAS